ncbi:hypothetical protein KAI04_03740 [Candidatus Pacearchaeota archaeon]|nr:hypothetical protein [Candidatus Pacearchaeota archaeon]
MKNKKAMSAIITIMLLIFIVVAGTAIIWKVLTKTVDEGLEEAKNCYDLIGKVSVNSEYTCYDRANDEMYVSVEVGDISIDELFIVIAYEDSATSFKLTNESTTIANLLNYDITNQIKIPNKNSGSTYIATSIIEFPSSIEIAPKIGDNLCNGELFTDIGFCT